LGSTDSVITRWDVTRTSGLIDVTDPEMTRFVMSPEEAVAALRAAAGRKTSAEIVAPALRGYRLGDLAEAYAKLHSVRITVIGPRAGESRYEWLVSPSETAFCRRDADDFVIVPGKAQAGDGPYSSSEAPRLDRGALFALLEAERAFA
jgi:FlaA1/EpsC-like NDP-sugar epimerase